MRAVMGLEGLKNTLNCGLRGRVNIAEAADVPPNGLRVNYHVMIEIKGGQRPACVAGVIACTIAETAQSPHFNR